MRIPAAPLALLAGLLTQSVAMNAQIDRSRPPAPGPAPAVNVGAHELFTLGNGLRVIVVENHKLPKVEVQVRFDHAPLAQGSSIGYIDLFGEVLEAGTATRDKAAIDEQVDRLGAYLTANSEGLSASVLKKHLGPMMDLIGELITAPAFPEAELAKARQRALSQVEQRKDDPDAIADAVGRAMTFGGGHPYGEVVTEATLRQVNREQLVTYHAKFFRPEAGYLVLVGDITAKEAKDLARDHFGKWKPAPRYVVVEEDGSETLPGLGPVRFLKQAKTPSGPRRVVLVDRPGAAQSIIRVGFPLNLQPKDIRNMAAQVMNTILGGGVFNARLMQNLREDKGWTYGTYSSLEADRFNGHFHTTAKVRTAVTDSAIAETIKELERMRQGRVSADELELAKRYMAGSFARSLEDPRTVARFALNTHLNELPPDHYATYLKRLEAVTAEDVQAAAEAFLHPDNAVIMVVGDKRKLLSKLEGLSWSENPKVLEVDHNAERAMEQFERVQGVTEKDVIEKYLAAIGGREAIGRIKDLRMDIAAQAMGNELQITQWYGLDGLFRSQYKSNGVTVQEESYDGERAMRSGPQGKRELEDMELGEMQFNGHAIPELHYARTAERVMLAGRTRIDGRSMLKVVAQIASGGSVGDYYDEITGLKVRRVEYRQVDDQNYTITTDYADYQPTGGVQFPRTITQYGGPMGEVTMQVTSIAVNQNLQPAFFATNLPERVVEPYVEPKEENPLEESPKEE